MERNERGITLLALIITIIAILILAGVTIGMVMGDNGVIKKAQLATNRYNQSAAEEKLAVVLSGAEIQKNVTGLTDEQLDEKIETVGNLMPKETEDAKNQYVVVDGYLFEVDRTVPKIGKYIGEAKDIIFPTVDATFAVSADKKSATISITASEKKKGIKKIEIWQAGEMIKEFPYDNVKTEITEDYEVKQNGRYVVRALGEVYSSKVVEVIGIVPVVEFEPNGSTEWKQGHQTKVVVEETSDRVVKAKYCWTTSVIEPADTDFPEAQTFDNGSIIEKTPADKLTGTYYLWTMLETQSGEKIKWRSEGFNFDNQGPTISTFTSTPVNYSSFKLNLSTIDDKSGIVEYEIFVNGTSQGKTQVDSLTTTVSKELTINNATYGDNSCYVIVKDKVGNISRQDITAKTLIDTTGPNITAFTATKYSETGITLSVTAQDTGTGTVKFEFYIDNVLQSSYTQTFTATTSSVSKSVTITGLSTGSHSCKVIAYDAKNNTSTKTTSGTTKLYAWEEWQCISNIQYSYTTDGTEEWILDLGVDDDCAYEEMSFNNSTGIFSVFTHGPHDPYRNPLKLKDKYLTRDVLPYYADRTGDTGKNCYKITSVTKPNGDPISGYAATVKVTMIKYKSEEEIIYSKGNNKYGIVTSTSSDTYPSDGHKNGYYYVKTISQ